MPLARADRKGCDRRQRCLRKDLDVVHADRRSFETTQVVYPGSLPQRVSAKLSLGISYRARLDVFQAHAGSWLESCIAYRGTPSVRFQGHELRVVKLSCCDRGRSIRCGVQFFLERWIRPIPRADVPNSNSSGLIVRIRSYRPLCFAARAG